MPDRGPVHRGRAPGPHQLCQVRRPGACDFKNGEARSAGVVRQVDKEPLPPEEAKPPSCQEGSPTAPVPLTPPPTTTTPTKQRAPRRPSGPIADPHYQAERFHFCGRMEGRGLRRTT